MPKRILRKNDVAGMNKGDLVRAVRSLCNGNLPSGITSTSSKQDLVRVIQNRGKPARERRSGSVPHPPNRTEPKFTQKKWVRGVGSNNCYAYAMGDYRKHRNRKSVPGERAGKRNMPSFRDCKSWSKRVKKDNPNHVRKLKNSYATCPRGTYKVMLFTTGRTASDSNGDFHLYRQHDTGIWSHKRGWSTLPLIRDAKGKVIWDPIRADKKYKGLHYKRHCGTYCVRPGTRVGASSGR